MRESVVRHYGTHYLNREVNLHRDVAVAEEDARQGSAALQERIERAIFKFGWRHGITADEARYLLLNTGVRL
jgi:hypothetical protein